MLFFQAALSSILPSFQTPCRTHDRRQTSGVASLKNGTNSAIQRAQSTRLENKSFRLNSDLETACSPHVSTSTNKTRQPTTTPVESPTPKWIPCERETAKVYDKSGIRTHALSDCHVRIPEDSALDRSAILPCLLLNGAAGIATRCRRTPSVQHLAPPSRPTPRSRAPDPPQVPFRSPCLHRRATCQSG